MAIHIAVMAPFGPLSGPNTTHAPYLATRPHFGPVCGPRSTRAPEREPRRSPAASAAAAAASTAREGRRPGRGLAIDGHPVPRRPRHSTRGRAGGSRCARSWTPTASGATVTRSELEDRFRSSLDAHALPRPGFNVALTLDGALRIEADCVWTAQQIVAELDGYTSHGTRAAFERDRSRHRRLQAAGWRVLRIAWRHLTEEPARLAAERRALLGPRRGIPSQAA